MFDPNHCFVQGGGGKGPTITATALAADTCDPISPETISPIDVHPTPHSSVPSGSALSAESAPISRQRSTRNGFVGGTSCRIASKSCSESIARTPGTCPGSTASPPRGGSGNGSSSLKRLGTDQGLPIAC